MQRQSTLLKLDGGDGNGIFDGGDHIHRLRRQRKLAAVERAHPHQIVQHRLKPLAVGAHALQEITLHLTQDTGRLTQQQVDIVHDRRQRRSQFLHHAGQDVGVFDAGDQIALGSAQCAHRFESFL